MVKKVKRIRITIGTFGREPRRMEVPEGSTVAEVFQEAGMQLSSGEKVWIDGEQVGMKDIVEKGDVVNIVGSRQGGIK